MPEQINPIASTPEWWDLVRRRQTHAWYLHRNTRGRNAGRAMLYRALCGAFSSAFDADWGMPIDWEDAVVKMRQRSEVPLCEACVNRAASIVDAVNADRPWVDPAPWVWANGARDSHERWDGVLGGSPPGSYRGTEYRPRTREQYDAEQSLISGSSEGAKS